jgi:hypothetical protein
MSSSAPALSLAWSLLVAATSACGVVRSSPETRIPGDRALPGSGRRPTESTDASARDGKKRVSAKQEPSTLIAVDRTQCIVDAEDFRRIRVGDDVACVWSPVGRP